MLTVHQDEQGRCRVEIAGELTIYNVAEIRQGLLGALQGCDETEVSLAGVSELDTAGLQLLIQLKREAKARGRAIPFADHSRVVLDVLERLGLNTFFGDPVIMPAQSEGGAS
ncbi:MAG: STAS domain-containing protein [Pseudomonadota bacterium]